MNAALPGDTIQIQPGSYAEKVTISGKNNTAAATESDRIIIEADPLAPPGSVVLTGASSVCTNGYAIQLQQSKSITIRGLTIRGTGGQAISLLGGNNQNQAVHIEQNRIFGNGSSECNGGITIARGNPDTLIVNNLIYANGRNGITFIDADGGPHYLIENTIHSNQWSGVNVARSHVAYLVNNSITQNGTAAGSTGGRFGVSRESSTTPDPQGIHLLNNLICGNRLGEINGPALDATDSGNLTPTGNEGTGVSASPGCEIPANVYANVNGPDGLPNTADDDFTLASHSPAIDRGMDPRTLGLNALFNVLFESDFLTEAARPSDGNADRVVAFDIGAFEIPNSPPVADAGPDQSVFTGTPVTLNGAQSHDPEGASLTFQWTIVSQPPGSSAALNNPTSTTPQFTPLLAGTYTIQLIVNDGQLDSAPDTVTVTARVNNPPTANANGPYNGTVGVPIQFNGTGSDPDGDPITFSWSFGDGGTAIGANPTHTYATAGAFAVTLTVTDSFGAFSTSQTTATVNQGLVLNPIGDKTVNLGETLVFTVSATSTSGTPTLFVSPLPLPNHATFNAVTGEFRFTPDTTQVGGFQLTFSAVSGGQSVSETITITVPQPPPGGTTSLRGKVENLNDTPLGNVKVTLRATGQTVFSGTDGFFTLTGLPSGRQELIVNGREANLGVFAILAVPVDLIEGVLNNLHSAITLPDVDVAAEVPVSPTFTTVVSNPSVPGVELTIPGGTATNSDGTPYTGKLSINPVPDYGRPESRPEELRPGMAITIQPAGVRFNPPAPLTFPNADGMVPGSELNLWSLSPDTGTFSIVGKGVVTQDGQSIVTTEGGVKASAWHFYLPPSGSSNTDVDESEGLVQDPAKQCLSPVSSTVALQNGCLGVEFALPSYRSLGASRPLRFIYKSNRANAQPLIPFNATIPVRAAVPPKLSYSLSVGGVDQGTETFINTSALDENRDETIRGVASFDASRLNTGVYPYRIKLTSNYLNSAISSFISDRVLVVNERNSPFGAGWVIEGLGKLNFSADGSVVFTDGNGAAVTFLGGPSTFASPSGEFSTLVKNPDGAFTRNLKDGTKINFNAQGLQSSVVDRNGNATSYSYDGSGKLVSIADPAGLVTTLAYTANLLASITDPAGRATAFTYNSVGDLTRVTLPDGSIKSFGYDARHLMTSETNERGFVVQREYDGVGRLVRATLPDGSVRTASSAQSVGFVDPSTGLGTITNPAPVVRPGDALSAYRDGNGNQQTVKIGKFGAPLRITDSSGQTTIIERRAAGNDGALQNGATFTTGKVGQAFSLDGVNDFVLVPHNPNLDPAGSFTIDAWVQTSQTNTSKVFLSKYECGQFCPSNVANSAYFLQVTAGRFLVFIRDTDAGGPSQTNEGQTIFGTRFIADGNFHHLAVVRDIESGQLTIYVDGTVDLSAPLNAGATGVLKDDDGEPDPLVIGGAFIGGQTTVSDFFTGAVDEVRFFARALSVSEIQTLFAAGNAGGRVTPPPGLISWWPAEADAADAAGGDGLPTRITRPNGAVVRMLYDSRGNLLSSTDPVGATTTFSYEANFNQVASIKDPKGNTTTITYDLKGNPTQIRDAQNNLTQMSYDARGLVTSVTSAVGTPIANTTSFTYDAKGNLLTTTDPKGNVTTLAYDSAGNVARSTDAENRVTEFTYDLFNRLISVIDPNNQVSRYSYDPKGNLIEVMDAKAQTTAFTYDALDRLSAASNPLGFSETFAYDANGNLTSTTNRNGQAITFDYDALNRLVQKTRPPTSTEVGNQVTTFAYDSVGNLTSVSDPDSTVAMAYDLANRLTSTTASSPSMPAKTTSYTYDLNGNRLTMTDPQSGVTNYVYDSLNRLTSATNPSGRTTSFGYDALGRRTSMTQGNGVVSTYSYDAASQLLSLVHQLGATNINSFSYSYDAVGNRKTKTSNVGTSSYTYDTLNRLVQATNPLPIAPETYVYDSVGNRTDSNQNGFSTFNQANQLLEDANFTYQYDNNGNLTRKTSKTGGPLTMYEYDAENKLVRATVNGTTASYKYDGLGRRVEKEVITVGSTVTRYIYDNEDILLELDGSNNIVARYTHGPGIDEPLILEKSGQSFFYHADGLGSITEITDASGVLKQQYTYSSFGKIESQLDPNFIQPYTFTGREYDPETGLYFYRSRYYDPVTGRFITEDRIKFAGGINFYSYVRNNPQTLVDPTGEIGQILIGAAIGAGLGAIRASFTGESVGEAIITGAAVGAVAGATFGGSILIGGAALTTGEAALVTGFSAFSISSISQALRGEANTGRILTNAFEAGVLTTATSFVGGAFGKLVGEAVEGGPSGLSEFARRFFTTGSSILGAELRTAFDLSKRFDPARFRSTVPGLICQ